MSFFNPNSQDIEQASNITADFIYGRLSSMFIPPDGLVAHGRQASRTSQKRSAIFSLRYSLEKRALLVSLLPLIRH